jgi:hypothetical protein
MADSQRENGFGTAVTHRARHRIMPQSTLFADGGVYFVNAVRLAKPFRSAFMASGSFCDSGPSFRSPDRTQEVCWYTSRQERFFTASSSRQMLRE